MYEFAIAWEWLAFAVRWLHVVTAIAWIGSSFYFIALDLGLVKRPQMPAGVHGEEWQVHGGGFYHVQKYLVAPAQMPQHLTWFKWEAYSTWLSGFAMLCLVYYGGADLFLIDRHLLDVSQPVAVAISLASLALGWIFYDQLCKSPLGRNSWGLMALLFVALGAFTATIMSANVFFIIIPNQKVVVTDLIAGRVPDPKYGVIAKQRSLHNNYLTLPVIFFMLSNHYPLAFATAYNWVIAALVFLMGVTIRHWFNTTHARKGRPTWTWLITLVLFIVIMWLSTVQKPAQDDDLAVAPAFRRFYADSHFPAARTIIETRCSMCHAAEPVWQGIARAPKNVRLETDGEIAAHAREIYIQAGLSHAMPPGNVTDVTAGERRLLAAWYESTIGSNVE
jgi:uncharacterized membrane protein